MEGDAQLQPPEQTRAVRRRRRPALSCRECRRRKIKCDHNEPCAHCVRQKTQCIYKRYSRDEPVSRSTLRGRSSAGGLSQHSKPGSPQTTPGSLPPPLQNAATQDLPSGRRASSTASASNPIPVCHPSKPPVTAAATGRATQHIGMPASVGPTGLPSSSQIRQPDFEGSSIGDILRPIQNFENISTSRAETGGRPATNELPGINPYRERDSFAHKHQSNSQPEWQAVLGKARNWGRSRWMGNAPEFATIIRCYAALMCRDGKDASFQDPEVAALVDQAGHHLQNCKNRAKNLKISRPTRDALSSGADVAPPSREIADELARLYFGCFESTHRILHAPTFWAEYHAYWDSPQSVTPYIRHKVRLVIGIGSSLYDFGDGTAGQRNMKLLHQWIYAAQTWLSGPLEKDRLDISGLQIYCLVVLARQIFSIGGDTVWVSMGSLVHRAMQIGLHRDPRHLPAMSLLQAELRRRLWATILELVVQSSLDAWMPPRITLSEFDTEPPSNINDNDLDESTTEPRPQPKHILTSTSLQLALLESLPTRLQTVELLNSLHSELSYPRVLALTLELTTALQTYSTVFTPHNSTPFHRNLLDFLTRRFLIPLHSPFSHQARTNPLFQPSAKISLDAALALTSPEPEHNPDNAGDANGDGDCGKFARLLSLGGGLFREGVRSATTAVTLALLAHVETQRGDGSLRRARQYRDFLAGAVRELLELAERRIRQGETNVKSHMFLSMVLAQVEAVVKSGGGSGVEVRVARAARDSLAFCEGLLGERAVGKNRRVCDWASPDGLGVVVGGMAPEGADWGFNLEGPDDEFDWDVFFTSQYLC